MNIIDGLSLIFAKNKGRSGGGVTLRIALFTSLTPALPV
jgi:hypothetical protein